MQFLKKLIITALILESRLILKKYKPFVVAITGSVGKTSTKDAIYSVLTQQGGYVRKSQKSLNSDIGLPLTIIGVPNAWRSLKGWMHNLSEGLKLILTRQEYPDCLVLEIGADHPGDISTIARWLKPDIAVIAKVARTPVHVEFFSSPEQVFEEKASLATSMKAKGTLILFADDDKVLSIAERVQKKQVTVMTFGVSDSATVRGSDATISYDASGAPVGLSFTVTTGGVATPVTITGISGATYMYPLLAATAVGIARGMNMPAIVAGLHAYDFPKGRMNIIPGINGSTLIDDTYNSSPDAVSSALHALSSMKCTGTKIAVLADMMELGKYSSEQHHMIGREVASVVHRLVTVGQRSRATAESAIKAGLSADMVRSYSSAVEAGAFLAPLIQPGDIVLIKGSQSLRMERVSAVLLRYPATAEKVLVRQEKEWLEKK